MPWIKTDALTRVSIFWWWFWVMLACQGRFLALYYLDFGFDREQAGFLIGAGMLFGMVANFFWAAVADFTSVSMRFILLVSSVGSAIAVALYEVPAAPMFSLWDWILTVRLVFSFFFLPMMTILDTLTVYTLEDPRREYGIARVWGAVAWGILNFAILGPLFDVMGYWVMVPAFVVSAIIMALCLFALLDNEDGQKQHEVIAEPKGEDASWWQRALGYVRNVGRIVFGEGFVSATFYLMVFVTGNATALVEGLVFLFWREDLHASNFLCGVTVAITVLVEAPLFFFSDLFLDRFSCPTLLILGSLSYSSRVWMYTVFEDPWMMLLVEPLHGVTVAFLRIALVHYSKELAVPGLETTAQSVAEGARSLGQVTGMVMGGLVMERFGSIALYRGASVIVLATTILMGVVEWTCHPKAIEAARSSPSETGAEDKQR
eukprot:CAMPEP_0196760580 /NCGR_PEP_ID=MMETSP1091-20130531/105297_1 /TAXON_ID=302021 /ORGANISM="Rhodomonas sp., Strain CCMP768" /LENGTH=431 /DNA_ID=CAMNT_0042109477 /DNA_START=63 /DNA_END=1358 /DNA_ORIENTATION=-